MLLNQDQAPFNQFEIPSVGRTGDRFTSEDVVFCTTPDGAREFG